MQPGKLERVPKTGGEARGKAGEEGERTCNMRIGRGILESEGDGSGRWGKRGRGENNRKMRKNMNSNPPALSEGLVNVLLHMPTKKKGGRARRNDTFIQASNPL